MKSIQQGEAQNTPRAPRNPIKLSPGCSRWRVADLEKWEAEQAMEG